MYSEKIIVTTTTAIAELFFILKKFFISKITSLDHVFIESVMKDYR